MTEGTTEMKLQRMKIVLMNIVLWPMLASQVWLLRTRTLLSLTSLSLSSRSLLLLTFLSLAPLQVVHAGIPESLSHLPLKTTGGQVVRLKDFKGKKPVYLKFWASWCGPCMKEMPHFQKIQAAYGDELAVISVNLGVNDSLQDAQAVVKRFGLTMPLIVDHDGQLAQQFKFVGTPYHLLFDRQLNLVHRGHKDDESLNHKIELLATQKTVDKLPEGTLDTAEPELMIPNFSSQDTALFFTATWCDWYLEATRPQASQNCIQSQKAFNHLVKMYPKVNWVVVASRLWTGEKDLKDYVKKYQIAANSLLDKSNKTFAKYEIQHFPTLLFFRAGQEVFRTTQVKQNADWDKVFL